MLDSAFYDGKKKKWWCLIVGINGGLAVGISDGFTVGISGGFIVGLSGRVYCRAKWWCLL